MIICIVKNLGCKIIWTEDLNSNQYYGEIQAVNPFHIDLMPISWLPEKYSLQPFPS